MTKVELYVSRENKTLVFSDADGNALCKLHLASEKTAQNKLDKILKTKNK